MPSLGFRFSKGLEPGRERDLSPGRPGALAWSEETGSLLGRPKPAAAARRRLRKEIRDFLHPEGEREGSGVPEPQEKLEENVCNAKGDLKCFRVFICRGRSGLGTGSWPGQG